MTPDERTQKRVNMIARCIGPFLLVAGFAIWLPELSFGRWFGGWMLFYCGLLSVIGTRSKL